ncbi:MAG: hypothetical protein AAFV33_13190, partial [Chloroflexota bacterium]
MRAKYSVLFTFSTALFVLLTTYSDTGLQAQVNDGTPTPVIVIVVTEEAAQAGAVQAVPQTAAPTTRADVDTTVNPTSSSGTPLSTEGAPHTLAVATTIPETPATEIPSTVTSLPPTETSTTSQPVVSPVSPTVPPASPIPPTRIPFTIGAQSCGAATVVTYTPGTQKNGQTINPQMINLDAALGLETGGIADESGDAVPLGFGGSLILDFSPHVIVNSDGLDLRIVEKTEAHIGQPWETYPEEARVFASVDGERWTDIGIARKDTVLDLGGLPFARYIYIQDVSDINNFEPAWANAFDVGAVEGGTCENRPVATPTVTASATLPPTVTVTSSPTATATVTQTPTSTATVTSSPTASQTPSATSTVTASPTLIPPVQPTAIATDTQTPTVISSLTATVTSTQTSTTTATLLPTETTTPLDTATVVQPELEASPTTETPVLTATPAATALNTATPLANAVDCAATTVVSFQPGTDHYGSPMQPVVPEQALGRADQQYVTIGIGGVITLGLPPEMALNENGVDIRIVARPITGTAAFIFASEDAENWVSLGIATGSATFDLSALPRAQ